MELNELVGLRFELGVHLKQSIWNEEDIVLSDLMNGCHRDTMDSYAPQCASQKIPHEPKYIRSSTVSRIRLGGTRWNYRG